MIRIRLSVSNQRGFTLAELLVVTAVIGIVMAGIFVIQREGQEAYLLGSNRVESQQNARVALDMMTRELRSAKSITTVSSSPDLTFVDQYDHTIRYQLAGTTLSRVDNGTSTSLIGGVQSLTFTYYDKSTVLYTGTDATKVWVVKVSVVAKTEEPVSAHSPGNQEATMESTVTLRNNLS